MTEWFRGPQWSSPDARRTWEPRVKAVVTAWAKAEVSSVLTGVRSSALLTLTPEGLVDLTRQATLAGARVVPLAAAKISGAYSAASARTGAPGLRVALAAEHVDPVEWTRAWGSNDDAVIGELLGFPRCCRDFFARTWGAGLRDTTWAQACGWENASGQAVVGGSPECSMLLRWLGVRLVTHLPCSFECEETSRIAQQFLALLPEDARQWALELLDAPTTWTAVNGAAEVTVGGALKFAASTDAWAKRREVVRRGSGAPLAVEPPTVWEDNGFATCEAMKAAHAVVAQAAFAPGLPVPRALDLGCGDGQLLNQVTTEGYGVEMSRAVVRRGRERRPASVTFWEGTIADRTATVAAHEPRFFDLALLMPGRLLEVTPEEATRVRAALAKTARRVVLYVYGDWLKKYGNLANLAKAAGYEVGEVHEGPGVQAAEVV